MPMSLPDDVLWEILSWLPPELLIKFRLVSQSWYAQIADPSFINKHLSNYCGNFDDEKEDYFPINLKTTNGCYLQIRGTCDGLLCCWSDSGVYLYNPSIRRAIHLPHDPFPNEPYPEIILGLGYDDSTQDIKLVKIDYKDGATTIYSTNENIWEKMNNLSRDFIPRRSGFWNTLSIFFGGFIYWYGDTTLIAFDLSEKKFRRVPYPPNVGTYTHHDPGSLSIANGSLHFMTNPYLLCIWKMKQDVEVGGDLWVKIFERRQVETRAGWWQGALSCQGRILFLPDHRRGVIDGESSYARMYNDWETEQYKYLDQGSGTFNLRFTPVKKNLRLLNLPGHSLSLIK